MTVKPKPGDLVEYKEDKWTEEEAMLLLILHDEGNCNYLVMFCSKKYHYYEDMNQIQDRWNLPLVKQEWCKWKIVE